jgi:hypothetical protein
MSEIGEERRNELRRSEEYRKTRQKLGGMFNTIIRLEPKVVDRSDRDTILTIHLIS